MYSFLFGVNYAAFVLPNSIPAAYSLKDENSHGRFKFGIVPLADWTGSISIWKFLLLSELNF